jgi:hypothetical protein
MGGHGVFDLLLELRQFLTLDFAGTWSVHINHGWMRAGEDAIECVEIGLGDGVELVVVAAGAAHGEGLEGLRHRVDLVVREGDHFIERIDRREAMQHHAKLRDANGAFVDAILEAWLRQEVTSDGFFDELRIRNVVVEGSDEVVAVTPRVRDGGVALGTVGLSA